jgi:hypothetical protein
MALDAAFQPRVLNTTFVRPCTRVFDRLRRAKHCPCNAAQDDFLLTVMTAATPIASLVRSMLADGVDHGAIVRAVEAAEISLRQRLQSGGRGTRLPSDWKPAESHIAYAAGLGMPGVRIAVEAEKFRNYWTAKTGAGATKRDWEATWRNWILNAMEGRHAVARNHRSGPPGSAAAAGRPQTGANAVVAGMGRLAHRLAHDRETARSGDRQIPSGADTAGTPDLEGSGT